MSSAKTKNAIRESLPKKPLIVKDGDKPAYLSVVSGKFIQKRVGVPVFDRMKKPKHLLGAFESVDEACKYLAEMKSKGLISEKQYNDALGAFTDYINLPQDVKDAFEAKVGVVAAEAAAPKPKIKKEKKEEVTPVYPSPTQAPPDAADAAAPATSQGKAPAYSVMPMDFAPEQQPLHQAGSLLDALAFSKSEEPVRRLEVVLFRGPGVKDVAIFRDLGAPSKKVIRSLQRYSAFDESKLDHNRGADKSYSVALCKSKHKKLMADLKKSIVKESKRKAVKSKRETKKADETAALAPPAPAPEPVVA